MPRISGGSFLSRFRRWFLEWFFSRAQLSSEDAARIRAAADRGTVLYVARASSRLEFMCWRTVLGAANLPVPIAANELSARASPELFVRLLQARRSVMLFLRRPPGAKGRRDVFGGYEQPILDLVRKGDAVSVVPLVLVWGTPLVGKRPRAKGWPANFMGTEEEPIWLRRFFQVLWRRRRALLRAATTFEVVSFLSETSDLTPDKQGLRFRFEVSGRIERERRVTTGPPLKTGRRIRQEVLGSRRVVQAIREAAGRYGEGGARRRAKRYAASTAADVRPWVLRLWRTLLDALFARLYQGIDVDEAGLARARAAAAKGPVVYVPSHRSHIDYLALSYVVGVRGVFPPLIAAGANLDFFPVGALFRRGGAFFLRRAFGGDRLYAAVFREYVRRVLRSGFSIEFFIEGGRSRTGKVLEPKLGLLSIIIDAVREGGVRNVQIVPMSIGYERVLEEATYAAELAGAGKRPENVGTVLRATRVLTSHHGRLDVQFDEPFDLGDFISEEDEAGDGGTRTVAARVARRIIWGITRATPTTPTALVATTLLASTKHPVAKNDLWKGATVLYRRIAKTDSRISSALRGSDGPNETAILRALELLEEDGLVQVRGTEADPLYIVPEDLRQRLDYYRGHVQQALVAPTVVAIAALARSNRLGEPIPEGELRGRALELSRLLESEFVFGQDSTLDASFARTLDELTSDGLLTRQTDGLRVGDEESLRLLAGIARHLVEAYWVAARGLAELSEPDLSARDWVARTRTLGETLYLQHAILRPEGIAQATIRNALGAFKSLGIVAEVDGTLRALRPAQDVAAEIEFFLT